ncbi:MAG: GspH/FimT family pseudopilin [Curvibacter sp.]|nr:GspH/FimT family pseudopilin [Curvibacter sp.]
MHMASLTSPRSRQAAPGLTRGFTLLELLVTMAILAIVLAIGVPSFRYIIYSSRISNEVNALVGSLQYARGEAIKRGQSVAVCASSDGATCSGATSWVNGWLVFVDVNGSTTQDTGEPVIQVQAAYSGGDSFSTSTTPPNGSNNGMFVYNREGLLTYPGGNSVVTLKPANAGTSTNWTRCLQISRLGQLTIFTGGQTVTATNSTCQ